jgi:hypothetical protein
MDGTLEVFYYDGEIRLVNLHAQFVAAKDPSIATRAMDFAFTHNSRPWKITVHIGGIQKFRKVYEENAPEYTFDIQEKEDLKKAA